MTTTSFLILEKKSQLIEKHRFKKYTFSKVENGLYVFYREYSNGVVDNKMRLNEDYIEFIQSLSQETGGIIYFLIKDIMNNEPIDSFSIRDYLNINDKNSIKSIKELDSTDVIELNRLYKLSFGLEA